MIPIVQVYLVNVYGPHYDCYIHLHVYRLLYLSVLLGIQRSTWISRNIIAELESKVYRYENLYG